MWPSGVLSSIFPRRQGGLSRSHWCGVADHPWTDQQPGKAKNKQSLHMYSFVDRTEPGHFCPTYLFLFTTLLSDELIEHGSKLLMDLLHLIDVAGNFVHGFHGNYRQAENNIVSIEMLWPYAFAHVVKMILSSQSALWPGLTIQVVVLLTVWVCEWVELLQQKGILQHPLDGFDQVWLQGGRVLLLGVALIQEGLEIRIGFGWNDQ